MTCHDVITRCKEGGKLEGTEIRTLVFLTLAFQTVFTAFNALQNLHSSLHDEESLGLVCLSVIYGTGIVSSIFSPALIGVAGAKLVLVLSFSAHCLYIFSNFYPSFATMVPAAFVLGVFLGPAWTSQGIYISTCAFSFSKSSSTSPYAILSRFNVFFFAVFATTQIVGNLVMSVVIRDGVGNSTEVDSFSICGRDDCPGNENATQIEDPDDWVIDITLLFFVACAGCGLCIVVFFLNSLPANEWSQKVNIRTTVGSFFQVMVSLNMMMLVPFIMFTAMEHALLLGAFTKSYVACPIGIHMVGYVMAANGATTPIFLLVFTQLARVTGRFLLIVVALVIHAGLLVVLYDWVPGREDEAAVFAIPIVWGVAESILQAQANALIALLFSDRKEAAFANYHFWRSIGYTVTFLNVAHLCVSSKIIVTMGTLGLGAVLYTAVEIKHKLEEKRALESPPKQEEDDDSADNGGDVIMRQISKTSAVLSDEDRQSFNRVELADIINEAKAGWRRDGDGFTLEVNKMMSAENLMCSKVSTYFHTRPNIDLDQAETTLTSNIQRSLSDGNLHSTGKQHGILRHGKEKKAYHRSASHAGNRDGRPTTWYGHGGSEFSSIPEGVGDEEKDGRETDDQTDITEAPTVKFQLGGVKGTRDSEESGILESVASKFFNKDSDKNSNNGGVFSVSYKKRGDSYLNYEFDVISSDKSDKENIENTRGRGRAEEDRTIIIEMPDMHAGLDVEVYKGKTRKGKNKSLSFAGKKSDIRVNSGKKEMNSKSSGETMGKKKKGKKSNKVTRNESFIVNGTVLNGQDDNDSDNDSDGFVDDEYMRDENDNEFFDDYSALSARKKKALVPKMESEDVDNIY